MSNILPENTSGTKQDTISSIPNNKLPHSPPSSLLDSPIAQLLGFGTSNTLNINLPNSPNMSKNLNSNISSNSFNSPPTFSDSKENIYSKSDENKNLNIRLHHFQPPPLLLPNQKILQPDFIESPRTKEQKDDFIDDFEFYPAELSSTDLRENLLNGSFYYQDISSSPSPRTFKFQKSFADVNLSSNDESSARLSDSPNNDNSAKLLRNQNNESSAHFSDSPTNNNSVKYLRNQNNESSARFSNSPNNDNSVKLLRNQNNENSIKSLRSPTNSIKASSFQDSDNFLRTSNNENSTRARFNSLPLINKSALNKSNIINLNLCSSPKLQPYLHSPTGQPSLSKNNDNLNTNSTVFNSSKTPSPKQKNFTFSNDDSNFSTPNNVNSNNSNSNNANSNSVNSNNVNSNNVNSNNAKSNNANSNNVNSNNSNSNNVNSNNVKSNNGLRPIFTNASQTFHINESDVAHKNAVNEIHSRYARKYEQEKEKCRKEIISMIERHREELKNLNGQPIIPTNAKLSSRSRNKNRNSNRRIRHADFDDSQPSISAKVFDDNSDADIELEIVYDANTNKTYRCIGSFPPTLTESVSGQPSKVFHESCIKVRIPNASKKVFLPFEQEVRKRQREEVIALNEETSSRLSAIIEEEANAVKELTEKLNDSNSTIKINSNSFTNSDASSSSSSAPNVFCIEDSDGSATKDDLGSISASIPYKYSSSSSSLSSSSFSSATPKIVNNDQSTKMKNLRLNLIPTGKNKNAPKRLLSNLPK